MGHKKSETTRIYAQLSGKLRKEFNRNIFSLFKTEKHLNKCLSVQLPHQLVEVKIFIVFFYLNKILSLNV